MYRLGGQGSKTGGNASKTARNTAISIVVLLVLFVGGGVGYTYFLGAQDTPPTAATAPVVPTDAPIKPVKPAANAPESAAVQTLTSPVSAGSNASISVKTNAGSKCTIAVVYGSVASTDSGLAAKVADEYGVVNWSWTVEDGAPLGTWPVKVTCVYNGKTGFVQGDLQVVKPDEQQN